MKVSALAKLGLIGVLSACSWMLTSHFIHGSRAQAQAQTQETPRPYAVSEEVDNHGAAAEAGQAAGATIFHFSMEEHLEVVPDQESIWVHTAVSITERRGPRKFMWCLDVQDATSNQLIFKKLYEEDAQFSDGEGEKLRSTFNEHIPMPKGSYRVGLRVYSMPRDFDVKLLQDTRLEKSLKHLENYREVTL